MNYERRALYFGAGINIFSSIVGITFFIITKSNTLFLDAFISLILSISTVISILVSKILDRKDSEKYPLGNYAIENIFLVFRALLMLFIISYTIFEGTKTIISFFNGTLVSDVSIKMYSMVTYCALMTLACFSITFFYSYYNKKMHGTSEIIKIEIKASLYDGLVTIFATSSLLIFTYIDFFNKIEPIGDSIVVLVLSFFYLSIPIKEIVNQIRILTDKRENQDIEKDIRIYLNTNHNDFNIYDIYCAYSGDVCSIYICLFPQEDMNASEINEKFTIIRQELYQQYSYAKVILLLAKEKLHNL